MCCYLFGGKIFLQYDNLERSTIIFYLAAFSGYIMISWVSNFILQTAFNSLIKNYLYDILCSVCVEYFCIKILFPKFCIFSRL